MSEAIALGRVPEVSRHEVSLQQAAQVWLRVALLSFGGPAGQIAVMHRILVEEKAWISEERFLHALNYCMLLPGPEAQQLATYIGWLMHRTVGGIVAGGLFIVPGIVAIMALSYVYAGYGNLPVIAALFFGLKAAVLAIVLEAVLRIGKRALKTRAMVGLAGVAFIAIFFFSVPFPVIIFGAAIIGILAWLPDRGAPASSSAHVPSGRKSEPAIIDRMLDNELPERMRPSVASSLRVSALWLALWLVPVIALAAALGSDNVFSQIAVFFSKVAVVTFGGAYAVLAYAAQQAVDTYGWVSLTKCLMASAWLRPRPARSSWSCSSWASWRLTAIPACFPRCSPARSGACWRPGSLSRPASCGSSWERHSSKRCAPTRR